MFLNLCQKHLLCKQLKQALFYNTEFINNATEHGKAGSDAPPLRMVLDSRHPKLDLVEWKF